MRRRSVSFYTLGCKLNQYETQGLKEKFRADGFEVVPFGEDADVSIVNTCTVTGKSDYQSRQAIRKAGRSSRDGLVVALGCYAQVAPETLADMPEVDLVVGTGKKDQLLDLVKSTRPGDVRVEVSRREDLKSFDEVDICGFDGHTRAFIKVQEGCDHFCFYCAVPMARGPSRSRSFESAVRQAQVLAERGYREVVLSGVNLGTYGRDLPGEVGLLDLMRALEKIKELERFRISSIEPWDISDEMVSFFRGSSKFCRHLHIPLQSGDDGILQGMNRPYRAEECRDLILRLNESIPGIAIGADVIVGFPGESEENFGNTYRLIEEIPLAYLHVFQFSKRRGTRAARMEGQVDPKIKKARSAALRELSCRKSAAFKGSFVGGTLGVLLENRRDGETGFIIGLTDNYIRVLCEGPDEMMGRIVDVRLDRVEGDKVIGSIDAIDDKETWRQGDKGI